MNRQNVIKKRKEKPAPVITMKRLVSFVLLFFFLAIIYNFYQGYQEERGMKSKIMVLQGEIEKLDRTKKDLQEKTKHINSKDFIEIVAREELGLVKKGETLYIVVEEK